MLSKVRKWPCKPMITFTAQRNCCSLHVTVTSTPQNLTTDLSVSQGMCDILFVTRSALSFCDRASPCSHYSIFYSPTTLWPPFSTPLYGNVTSWLMVMTIACNSYDLFLLLNFAYTSVMRSFNLPPDSLKLPQMPVFKKNTSSAAIWCPVILLQS